MKRLYDLTLDNQGKVKAWNRGFFEHTNELSLTLMPELMEVENYRMKVDEYNKNKAAFDKFMNR